MDDFKFDLGDEVQDLITKFKGIVRGRAQYLTGCNTYAVQSQKIKVSDTEIPKWQWLDEDQLKLLANKKIKLTEGKIKTTSKRVGGPNNRNQRPPSKS